MGRFTTGNPVDRGVILSGVLDILAEMTSDMHGGFAGAIEPHSRLGADLAFESIQIVRLVVAIQKHFQRQDLPFQQLFLPKDGEINDLRVSDLVNFLCVHLSNNSDSAGQRPRANLE